MAFCPNCGAKLPDGSAFCSGCGARLDPAQSSRSYASAPASGAAPYAPAYGYAAPAPKKSYTGLIVGIVAALVLIGAVIGILFATGVLGGGSSSSGVPGAVPGSSVPIPVPTPTPTAAGVWRMETPYNGDGDNVVLVLDPDGKGYSVETIYWSSRTDTKFHPLTWSPDRIYAEYDPLFWFWDYDEDYVLSYTWSGDTLTVIRDGERYAFYRDSYDPYASDASLRPGTYTLLRAIEDGEECTSYYEEWKITVNGDGTAASSVWSESVPLHYDGRFFYADNGSDPIFYYYQQGELTFTDGEAYLTFTRKR